MSTPDDDVWDDAIVGSGAGGGTLAARLAEAGMRVFLIEAGGDAPTSEAARMPDDYHVPAFHAFASENPAMSWTLLKAHTRNHAGTVRLRSTDPRDMPVIDFHYFEEGDDVSGDDMRSVVEAVRFVRGLTAPLVERGLIAQEELPGASVQDDADLARYIRDNAWGHHASCTCAIGAPSAGGVLDSRLSVHGVRGLRVVDASVFPKIPGFFLASAIYMVAEKAAEMILSDAARTK